MTYVRNVTVVKMIFKHENMLIDLTTSSKTRLYRDDKLVFMGDGYKAITTMLKSSEDKQPVKDKFHAQLNMREKPRFSGDDIETLRKQAIASHAQQELAKSSKKKRK